MRADGALDRACARTGKERACKILAAWDGRSNKDSVGYQIFDAFAARVPTAGVWKVPFDYRHPLATPRGLIASHPRVVKAMSDAIAALRQAKVGLGARWGSLQVAGDRGAPPIPLAAAPATRPATPTRCASHDPRSNKRLLPAVTYGSSHIQAVAFLPGGRVGVHTILTYGQSEDPTSPYSSDQTRMFSDKQWVTFAWTRAEVRCDWSPPGRARGLTSCAPGPPDRSGGAHVWRPRKDSNLRSRLRRAVLYPLSYGGSGEDDHTGGPGGGGNRRAPRRGGSAIRQAEVGRGRRAPADTLAR